MMEHQFDSEQEHKNLEEILCVEIVQLMYDVEDQRVVILWMRISLHVV